MLTQAAADFNCTLNLRGRQTVADLFANTVRRQEGNMQGLPGQLVIQSVDLVQNSVANVFELSEFCHKTSGF